MSIVQTPADRPEFLEKHYTVGELAEAWGLVEDTIRPWFIDEVGVLKIEHRLRKGKRGYLVMRVPESVARRVYRQRTGQTA
jgi:hypothetical protein